MQTAGTKQAAKVKEAKWHICSFTVHRRGDETVKPYRVVVYTQDRESASLGVGLSSDEVARLVDANFWDGVGVTAAVNRQELADFWELLAVTVRSGGTETTGLLRATRLAKTARFRGVLASIRAHVNSGKKFHQALGTYPKVFPADQTALAEAAAELVPAERADLYLSLATLLRDQDSRMRQFHSVMFDQYLNWAMLVALSALVVFLFIPSSAELFANMGVPVPKWLGNAFKVSLFAKKWWMFAVPALVAVLVLVILAVRAFIKSKRWQKVYSHWPIVGPVVRGLALARSLPIFALLKSANIPSERMFRLAGASAGNGLIEEYFQRTHRRCVAGSQLEDAFLQERLYLGLDDGRRLAGKLEAGSQANDVRSTLDGLAKEFSETAKSRIDKLPKILKPISLGLTGVVVGVAILFVALPNMLSIKGMLDQQNKDAMTRIMKSKAEAEAAHKNQ